MDERFTDRLWEHEDSRIGEQIPGNLHQKQVEMLLNPARHRWLFWGNQAGKTTLGAVDLVLKALGRHPLQRAGVTRMPPRTAWASALSWELWENILLPELLTWIPRERIVDAPEPYKHSTKRDIVLRADNGKISRITGKAAEQGAAKYQSARVDDVWLDEEHPEAVWDEIQPRLLRYGGSTLATMTPLLGFTWVHGRVYEPVRIGQIPRDRHAFSHAGIADNPAIDAASVAELSEELKHNPSQLAARLYGQFVRPHGAVLPWDPDTCQADVVESTLIAWRQRAAWFGAIDLGKWRFAFQFGAVDHEGVLTLIDEVFSQNEDVDTRAKRIHDCLKFWGAPTSISIPADCADPVGIDGLNAAFDRMNSPYSCYAIEAGLKKKTAGIQRIESMMNRGAFKVRRGMGQDHAWRLGMNAGKPGKPVMGSRWMWEAANWQYPKTEDGKIQKDEPDDASADGADMMDATRYLVMQYYAADAPKEPAPHRASMSLRERAMQDLRDLDQPKSTKKFFGVMRQ